MESCPLDHYWRRYEWLQPKCAPNVFLGRKGLSGEGGGERTALSLCLKASHLAPRIAHVADQAGTAITRGITSAAMHHPLIDFAGDSVAVNLLFNEYYGIDDNSNGNGDNNNGGEGKTVLEARVLDRCRNHGEAARTGLHGGNCLASMSLLEELIFSSSVGEAVAAGAGNGPMSLAVKSARRAVECWLATTIPVTAGPLLLLSSSLPSPLPSPSLSLSSSSSSSSLSSTSSRGNSAVAAEASAILARLRLVMWQDVGVIRFRMGLERAVSELSAMLD